MLDSLKQLGEACVSLERAEEICDGLSDERILAATFSVRGEPGRLWIERHDPGERRGAYACTVGLHPQLGLIAVLRGPERAIVTDDDDLCALEDPFSFHEDGQAPTPEPEFIDEEEDAHPSGLAVNA